MSKHTPGRWEFVGKDDPRGQPVPYYRGLIALVQKEERGTLAVVTSSGRSVPQEEWEANARLIAAAPDLLAALKEIAAISIEAPGISQATFERAYGAAQAAITKATGE